MAAQAIQIDEATWRFAILAEPGGYENWVSLREPVEQAVLRFVNLARRDLGDKAATPLARLSGRPPPNDPVWSARGLDGDSR
jgi:hypothetical protein